MFCRLENDEKTFLYLKEYVSFLENTTSIALILDNQIQYKEIMNHLYVNNKSIDDQTEIDCWIQSNAKKFREYLNTIKLVYVVWKCSHDNDWQNITYTDFVDIEKKLNCLKSNCLDTIF